MGRSGSCGPCWRGPPVQHVLPDVWLGEDHQELLGVVFDDLELAVAQMELVDEGVTKVMSLCTVAVGVEPADGRPVDEVIVAALEGAGRRHRTEATCRPSTWVTGVPCRHGIQPTDYLRVGTKVSHRRGWWGRKLVVCHSVRLGSPSFMVMS